MLTWVTYSVAMYIWDFLTTVTWRGHGRKKKSKLGSCWGCVCPLLWYLVELPGFDTCHNYGMHVTVHWWLSKLFLPWGHGTGIMYRQWKSIQMARDWASINLLLFQHLRFFFCLFILVQRSLDSVQVSKFCKFLGLAVWSLQMSCLLWIIASLRWISHNSVSTIIIIIHMYFILTFWSAFTGDISTFFPQHLVLFLWI